MNDCPSMFSYWFMIGSLSVSTAIWLIVYFRMRKTINEWFLKYTSERLDHEETKQVLRELRQTNLKALMKDLRDQRREKAKADEILTIDSPG
jgi:uncharacterized membrane protein